MKQMRQMQPVFLQQACYRPVTGTPSIYLEFNFTSALPMGFPP